MPYSSFVRRLVKNFKSDFIKTIWWWQSGWEACTPESVTILHWDVNNKSMQDLEFPKMWVGSVIICNKSNFEVRSWSWQPSKLILSILHHYLDFASKSPINIVKIGLHLDTESRFNSRFDLSIWSLSCVWLGNLCRWMKWQILLAMLTPKLIIHLDLKYLALFKEALLCRKCIHTPHLLQLEQRSARFILYPGIFKFGSLGVVSELKTIVCM